MNDTTLKQRILNHVASDIETIETALHENLGANVDLVAEVAGHVLFSGGKRFRPLLMVLAARLCGYSGGREAFFSTIFEYLHVATLIHDDLVDGADLRRGEVAAYRKYGNEVAVLTGDFLLARSLSIASETEDPKVIRVIAGITENMSQGEIDQLHQKGNIDLSEADYFEIIRRKTAVLMEGACHTGALIAGADEVRRKRLAKYGYHLGIAFQIADDLLDYTADTKALGKRIGADLREGKLTLPVIRAIAAASEEDRKRIRSIVADPCFTTSQFQALIDLLRRYRGLDYARQAAEEHVRSACAQLDDWPESPHRSVLFDIAEYALQRGA